MILSLGFAGGAPGAEDELICFKFPHPYDKSIGRVNKPLQVLFEDDDLFVIYKPRDLPVHPTVDQNRTSVLGLLPPGLLLVHRLDAGTTGVLILAKNAETVARLQTLWPEIKKSYHAGVVGSIDWREKTVKSYLRDKGRGRVQSVRSGGQVAITEFTVLRSGSRSLVEARLKTGRRHQIRVQLADLGHPILGDPIYGSGKKGDPLLLHCHTIELPEKFKGHQFVAAPPPEFSQL